MKTNELQAQLAFSTPLKKEFFSPSLHQQKKKSRLSADQLLLDLGQRGEGRLAEGEGVAARLQLALSRAHEVRLDQVQLGRRSRALGLRLRLAGLGLVQGGGRAGVEVRVGVGMGERVQPGVVEAFFCRGSLPVHTNTITLQMSGNS